MATATSMILAADADGRFDPDGSRRGRFFDTDLFYDAINALDKIAEDLADVVAARQAPTDAA